MATAMDGLRVPRALRSLARRDLRLFFAGQVVSLVGTWMQNVAQPWLVWTLTHDAAVLGLTTFLAQVPVLVLGPFGGSLADRVERRRLVVATQTLAALDALALAVLTLSGVVRTWHVLALSALLGLVGAFDAPARQTMLAEIAEQDLANAIALNSAVVNGARAVGPAIAGVVLAALGPGACFLLNALSYGAIVVALGRMSRRPAPAKHASQDGWQAGLAYAWRTPHVRALLALLAATSVFALPYSSLLPVFAAEVLRGGAGLLGWMYAAAGVGAFVAAALLLRREGLAGLATRASTGCLTLALGLLALAMSRSPALSLFAVLAVGFGFMTQATSTNSLLQGLAPDAMRGRLMGIYSAVFIGLTPLGALVAGAVAKHVGAPWVSGVGAVVVGAAALAFRARLPGLRETVRRDYATAIARLR